MDENKVQEIIKKMKERTTKELSTIVQEHDSDQWTEEAFEAINRILKKREQTEKGTKKLVTNKDSKEIVSIRISKNQTFSCEKCGSTKFDYDSSWEEYTCGDCGWIIQDTEKISFLENTRVKQKKPESDSSVKVVQPITVQSRKVKGVDKKKQKKIASVIGIITGLVSVVGFRSQFIDYKTSFIEGGISGTAGYFVGYILSLFVLFIIYGDKERVSELENSARKSYIILVAILPLLILIPILELIIDPLVAFFVVQITAIIICFSSFLLGLKYYKLGVNKAFTSIILSPIIFLLLVTWIIFKLVK